MKYPIGDLVDILKKQGVAYGKSLILKELSKSWPTLMAIPVLGPGVGWIVGYVTGKILNVLATNAEFLVFMVNTYVRVTAQARDFEEAVKKRDQVKTEADLVEAEKDVLKTFDDLVKFNR